MIDLTPLEVRQKKGDFRRSFRGYDPELVNDFLDLVADRMEELVKENMAMRDVAEATQDELAAYREKERALSEALMAAQRLREDARSHAQKESELMVREARLAAETAREDATRQLAREEETLRQVRARRAQLVESFRRLLERELSELAVIEETLGLQPDDEAPARKRPAKPKAGAGERAARPQEAPPEEAEEGEAEAGEAASGEDVQEDWLSSLVEEQRAE